MGRRGEKKEEKEKEEKIKPKISIRKEINISMEISELEGKKH